MSRCVRGVQDGAMSYGVIASKSAHVMVESTLGVGGTESDIALDRFQGIWGGAWVQGRLTVTRLHVNFIPARAGRGMAMLDLNLRDLQTVELSGGRVGKTLGMRTETHLVHVRMFGAAGLATELAQLVAAAKKLPLRRR